MTLLREDVLDSARRRRSAGENLKALAAEVGVTWQKLDKALRNGLRGKADSRPQTRTEAFQEGTEAVPPAILEATPDTRPLSLTEKYRPKTLAGLWGQPKVVQFLQRFARLPYSTALLFQGETGTGKTSAALVLAAELGCAVDQSELGGVWVIASGEQSADAVRETCRRMWQTPFAGSGWKVVIVNEVDRMSAAAETIWLDRLENLPPRTVVVFTTNYPDKLSARLRDRCVRVEFESRAKRLVGPARDLLAAVWRAETGNAPDRPLLEGIVKDSIQSGQVSLRRAMQLLSTALLEREGRNP
jgi:replication-associated recombination protein RarA